MTESIFENSRAGFATTYSEEYDETRIQIPPYLPELVNDGQNTYIYDPALDQGFTDTGRRTIEGYTIWRDIVDDEDWVYDSEADIFVEARAYRMQKDFDWRKEGF